MHLLGPLTRADARRLQILSPELAGLDARTGLLALRTDASFACRALEHGLCRLHESGDKPRPCVRFPYLLTATVDGGRVGTTHRCPCRSLGGAVEIDLADAERSLSRGPRLLVNHRAPARIQLTARTSVSFSTYRGWEERIFEALAGGLPALGVLGFADGVDRLLGHEPGLVELGRHLRASDTDGHLGAAIAGFGHGLLEVLGEAPEEPPARPFAPLFAGAALGPGRTARAIVNDWIADAIWSLEWTALPSLEAARAELALRIVVVENVADRLVAGGASRPHALAEAIAMADQAVRVDAYRLVATRLSSIVVPS